MKLTPTCGLLLSVLALTACKGNAAPPKNDRWLKTDTTSKLNDVPGVEFSVQANEVSELGTSPDITIGCTDGQSYFYITPYAMMRPLPDDVIDHVGFKKMTWRIDKDAPSDVTVQLGPDFTTFGWWGRDASTTVRKIAKAKMLVFKYDAESGARTGTYEFSFDLTGLDGKMAELVRTCKWPPA